MTHNANTVRLLDSFSRISRLLASLEGFSGEPPLGKLDLLALMTLQKDGRAAMSELGRKLGVSLSAVTKIADRLSDGGLVARVRDDGDRRVVRVDLTIEGQVAATAHLTHMTQAIDQMLEALTSEEQENLVRLLERISGAWDVN